MDEQEDRIAELESKTEQNSYEFIVAELDVCFSSVKNGIRDLESGNREAAQKESEKAEMGYKTVIGFVARLGEEQQRAEVEKRWNELRARLDMLHSMLKDSASE